MHPEMGVGDESDYLPVSQEGAVQRPVKTTAWLSSPPNGGTQRNHDTAPLTPTPLAPMIGSCRLSGESVPVFLLTVFAKNEKADLSTRESTALAATARTIVTDYRGRRT